jgi:tape measure domain-containing protein
VADDKKTLELQIRIAADEALRAVSSLKGEMQTLSGEFKKLSEADGAALKRTFEQAQASAEKAAASMKLFGASSGELRQIQAQVKAAAVDLVTKGFDPQSTEVKKLTEEYKRLEKEAGDLDRATGKNITSFGDLKNALGSLAQVAALTKTLDVIKDMGVFALSTADSFQTARNEFGVLLGDMEAGAGLFNELKVFNDKTPFSLDTLTQATNVLLTAKVPLAELQEQLTKFGDLSQGNAERFTSYINAFSRAAAKGKVDMENLNTYLHQGVPILEALGKRFGVLENEIVEMVSQGKISFTDFSAALADLTAEGGKYFGGMELGSRSLAAMQEGLKEAVNSLAASFGDMLLPAAIKVVEALTAITNAINESPIVKGALAGALVALTGYLAAMAIKAGIAFAAQMSLNLAIGALSPTVLAATLAVAGLAAAYTIYATDLQKAKRESEDFALRQKEQNETMRNGIDIVRQYRQAIAGMTEEQLRDQLIKLNGRIDLGDFQNVLQSARISEDGFDAWQTNGDKVNAVYEALGKIRKNFIDSQLSDTDIGKIRTLNEQLESAFRFLRDPGLTDTEKSDLGIVIGNIRAELEKLTNTASEADRVASKWKEAWADVWKQFQAEQSGDPFAGIELERGKKLADTYNNEANKETIDQINAYYDAERRTIAKDLKDEEERLARELTETRVDDLEYELREALKNLDTLEARRVTAAAGSEEEITAIREQFAMMRVETEKNYAKQIADARIEEARRAAQESFDEANKLRTINVSLTDTRVDDLELERDRVLAFFEGTEEQKLLLAERYAKQIADVQIEEALRAAQAVSVALVDINQERLKQANEGILNWGQALADTLSLALMDIEGFSEEAAVILGELSAAFIELSASAALGGFEEFGRALGEGEDAADSMSRALAQMAQQILRQLPMMFLQAGLQLIATPGMWPLGLGFIAAAGSSAIISGYVDGTVSKAKKDAEENARGGVYDEYGKVARAYAAGGAFTNQIVSRPTYFRYGGGLGLMGEAGPEAVMPLKRGGDGRLGISAFGGPASGGPAVYVIIQNYTGEEVRTEESSDSSGASIHKVIIGAVKQSITGGELDQSMSSRYGLRARGV